MNATQRLYYDDVYCISFEARVLSCRETAKKPDSEGAALYEIVLDRTAFYPEGGGQNGDHGVLRYGAANPGDTEVSSSDAHDNGSNLVHVVDTIERGSEVVHITDGAVPAGSPVCGELDWEFRFDQMQNHSGEHLVSGLIHSTYGYDNVGFHMGADFITIDLSGPIDEQGLRDIELRANEAVWKNLPCVIEVVDHETAAGRTYRSKKEIEGDVRIVTFPGVDVCACCGTHVTKTGEIGPIRLLGWESFKGGMRIRMLCGRRALLYDIAIAEQNHKISVALSVPPEKTAEGVEHMKEQDARLMGAVSEMEDKYFNHLALSLKDRGNCLVFIDAEDPNSVRRLSDKIMEECGGVSAVFSGSKASGFRYVIGEKDGDVRALIKKLNGSLCGRGGGRPYFAQGSVAASKKEISEFFKTEADEKPYVIVDETE